MGLQIARDLIHEGAHTLMRLDRSMGHLPFARFSAWVSTKANMIESAEKVNDLTQWVSLNLGGGQSGLVPQLLQGLRRAATDEAKAAGQAFVDGFRRGIGDFEGMKGFDDIASRYEHDYSDLLSYMMMRLQVLRDQKNGVKSPVFTLTPGTPTANMMKRMTDSGLVNDTAFHTEIDQLINRTLDMLDEMATNWMLSRRKYALAGDADAVVDLLIGGLGR